VPCGIFAQYYGHAGAHRFPRPPLSLLELLRLNFNREMKDSKKIHWLTLFLALGLLYVGIDRVFFDTIAGGDLLQASRGYLPFWLVRY
jgi:hypothetical protein